MRQGKLSVNIIANLIGKIWTAGIGIVLVPLYIRFLGKESYGLVGFYGTLIGSMTLLDMGLSTTLNRELAKARVNNTPAQEVRNMVFSVERIYWIVGLVIAILVVLFSPIIATHWVKAEKLSTDTIRNAVMLMGLVVAFQWPISIYNGGLMGLERQVLDNVLMAGMSTLRAAGILAIFIWVKPSIQLFFIWQAVISFFYVMFMRIGLWHYLPKSESKAVFSKAQIKRIWRFAAGMTGIGLITFFISQIDKIVLSKMLPLTQYGYYILSFTVATSLSMIVSPINAAFFPRLAGLVAKNDEPMLKHTYHRASRLIATVVFPVGLMLIFFANNILLDWTKDAEISSHTTRMVQVLVTGSLCNSLMVTPYLLILARGRTRYVIYQNLIAAVAMVPMLFWWTNQWGALGATFVWFSVNAGYVIFSIPFIHNKLLAGELTQWYIKDTLFPLLPPLILIATIKFLLQQYYPGIVLSLFSLGVIGFFVFVVSLMFLPEIRQFVKQKLSLNAVGRNSL